MATEETTTLRFYDIQIDGGATRFITNTQQAQSSLINQKAAQQGTFLVTSVHHFGNFRQPDAYSWVTEFNGVPTNVQAATPSGS